MEKMEPRKDLTLSCQPGMAYTSHWDGGMLCEVLGQVQMLRSTGGIGETALHDDQHHCVTASIGACGDHVSVSTILPAVVYRHVAQDQASGTVPGTWAPILPSIAPQDPNAVHPSILHC
ncbi:hypothetical protein B5807_06150 [Epicoccum nigrum]|uniref:Uncharacterized protein n=1 Tax=Epicoccum nigrum TaxID=105696 RepID=A0A1Y2M1E8_EPING|nr:hypothetical protein B5807_06150 [Epicoccum nigrum]